MLFTQPPRRLQLRLGEFKGAAARGLLWPVQCRGAQLLDGGSERRILLREVRGKQPLLGRTCGETRSRRGQRRVACGGSAGAVAAPVGRWHGGREAVGRRRWAAGRPSGGAVWRAS